MSAAITPAKLERIERQTAKAAEKLRKDASVVLLQIDAMVANPKARDTAKVTHLKHVRHELRDAVKALDSAAFGAKLARNPYSK